MRNLSNYEILNSIIIIKEKMKKSNNHINTSLNSPLGVGGSNPPFRGLGGSSEGGSGQTRILALDILRGITIAGMILVNNPGTWGSIYAPLEHAQWNGLTPTDLVFPNDVQRQCGLWLANHRRHRSVQHGNHCHPALARRAVYFAIRTAG